MSVVSTDERSHARASATTHPLVWVAVVALVILSAYGVYRFGPPAWESLVQQVAFHLGRLDHFYAYR